MPRHSGGSGNRWGTVQTTCKTQTHLPAKQELRGPAVASFDQLQTSRQGEGVREGPGEYYSTVFRKDSYSRVVWSPLSWVTTLACLWMINYYRMPLHITILAVWRTSDVSNCNSLLSVQGGKSSSFQDSTPTWLVPQLHNFHESSIQAQTPVQHWQGLLPSWEYAGQHCFSFWCQKLFQPHGGVYFLKIKRFCTTILWRKLCFSFNSEVWENFWCENTVHSLWSPYAVFTRLSFRNILE